MNPSDIIVPIELQVQSIEEAHHIDEPQLDDSVEGLQALSYKLRDAYRSERERLEVTEVELNRSRIFMVDKNGNMRIVPLMSEH
ncbi:hypothetical protein [Vibrio genomosp. F10]|uniref:Uncharacterized protein n=1 Tax=Vibrio genomosp. F10 TaxID=723171 RepID=A0A1B9QVL6_9VIBR|nr:hypothetical protein [Vibrio genomosp. F10]OCH73095.1 hypothetical protein A6E14_14975 [Vibrio genomosp. F10]OEE96538.1 hypothetical protein A1QM_03645 [Vibrio genomosp. F10 str. 9ZC157]OEE97175.1 hypothetical protein A1QK_13380 [Vibrio genomosp. F10 str. 9ZD137]OEF10655.1 hypothetical protein A1QI_00715 [Vibrio genomosp. F10 str. 9ZB36]